MIQVRRLFVFACVLLTACVDPYQPPVISGDVDIVVVDGFLNSTDKSATVVLSRAVALGGGSSEPESSASVNVEDENGSTYALVESTQGTYTAANLPLLETSKYRLRIQTQRDQEYLSDFITLNNSPDIDSITWRQEREDINFYVSTHDPLGTSQYYLWTFVETWEYIASFYSTYKMLNGTAVERPVDERIYRCWTTKSSTQILVGSTTRLSAAVISEFPITAIEGSSPKLSQRYSILVRQRSISKEAFEFWSQLKKNSESLGGLFDPLPSQVTGNIRSVDSSEPVLGYFSGGTVKEKRIFIPFKDLPSEIRAAREHAPCGENDISVIPIADIPMQSNSVLLIDPIYSQAASAIIAFTSATSRCVDCRSLGGTTQQPDFW